MLRNLWGRLLAHQLQQPSKINLDATLWRNFASSMSSPSFGPAESSEFQSPEYFLMRRMLIPHPELRIKFHTYFNETIQPLLIL